MEYESVLAEVGGFGRVQLVMFLALSFTSFKAVLDIQLLVLSLHESRHRCVGQNVSGNSSQNEFNNRCSLTGSDNTSRECTEFEYAPGGVFTRSLLEEYNLVCGRRHYATLMMSLFFLGKAVGFLFGTLGDRIGRKRVLVICGLADIVTTVLPVFMPDVRTQLLARFLKGLPAAIAYQGLLILEEMTQKKHRAVLGNLYWVFWCFGYMSSGVIVYLLKDWRLIQWFSLVFCTNYLVIFAVVPESPRWLVLRGRIDEAMQVLRRIARWNGIVWRQRVNNVEIEPEPTGNLLELVTYPAMRTKTLVIFNMFTMFTFCYVGLSTDTTFISSSIVVNVLISGALEIPSCLLAWLVSDKFGRKYTTLVLTAISGACVIAVPNIPDKQYEVAKAIVAISGKCLLNTGYCIMDVWAAEVFPTSIRNNGLFLGAGLATFADILTPSINSLGNWVPILPSLIFGGLSIVSAFTALLLPETKGMPLPETVLDSEGFVRGREQQWAAKILKQEKEHCQLIGEESELQPVGGKAGGTAAPATALV